MDKDNPDSAPPDQPERKGSGVALLGLGTVGSAVARTLLDDDWRANAEARGHVVPRLVGAAVKDVERERELTLPESVRLTSDIDELVASDDVDVVVELIGGTDVAADAFKKAFAKGKAVVSANKELLARQGKELEAAAREAGVALRFEAAVAAGVPVLGPLVWDLGANRVISLRGIVNGTTNHILSTMASDAREYDDVLSEAQARGYAEADPSSDVEGLDAAYKLVLLARLAFDGWADPDDLRRSVPGVASQTSQGITGVTRAHMSAAARLGLAIKLVARAERRGADSISAAVTPMAVAAGSPLGATGGVTNIVDFDAEPVGRVTMAGPGAGGPATSSAVLADLLVLANSNASTWEQLPAAGDLQVVDDLGMQRGWFVAVEGLGAAGIPDVLKEMALATTDEGFVTPPVLLTALVAKLGMFERAVTIYPILSDA
ncbi:MAG: homoserine dehydrogenase [Chloroflexota bacterium]